jgi:hypothetical protein
MTGDPIDNCNSDKDDDHAAKAALAKAAPATAAAAGEDSIDGEETRQLPRRLQPSLLRKIPMRKLQRLLQ